MQELMPPVNTPDKLFHDGDPTQGIEGTIVTAEWLNNDQSAVRDIQQELVNVLAAAAMQPDPSKQDQLITAINSIIGGSIPAPPVTSVNTKTGAVVLSAADVGALPAGGTAAAATKLATARTIGGVAFDGTANINLPGVNAAGNQSTTGNAATASKLATARTISGVAFDGSANITLTAANVGALPSGGTAAAATKLATARTISGVAFDGSANITLTAANVGALPSGGTAAAATKLATARTINGVAFDGTANIAISAAAIGSYTKAESDGRYGIVNLVRRGGQQIFNSAHNWIGNWESPAGCVVTGVQQNGADDGRKLGFYYRQLQYLNKQTGAWVNIGD